MAQNFVYFDLETQRSANDVGGWGKKSDMLMSVGVTYSTKRGGYHIYPEEEVNDLIDELLDADLVIGYNHLYFDYEVLMGYTILNLKEQTANLDLMLDLERHLEHRPKLEAVAGAHRLRAVHEEGDARLLVPIPAVRVDRRTLDLAHRGRAPAPRAPGSRSDGCASK